MLKPMMVVGVRQIGKTYTIDRFCRDNFKNYIYINLLDRKDIVKLYKEEISISDKIKKGKTPVIYCTVKTGEYKVERKSEDIEKGSNPEGHTGKVIN